LLHKKCIKNFFENIVINFKKLLANLISIIILTAMKSFTAKQRMKNIDANAAVLSSARIDAICFHAENSGNALIGSEKRSSDQQYLSVANIS